MNGLHLIIIKEILKSGRGGEREREDGLDVSDDGQTSASRISLFWLFDSSAALSWYFAIIKSIGTHATLCKRAESGFIMKRSVFNFISRVSFLFCFFNFNFQKMLNAIRKSTAPKKFTFRLFFFFWLDFFCFRRLSIKHVVWLFINCELTDHLIACFPRLII